MGELAVWHVPQRTARHPQGSRPYEELLMIEIDGRTVYVGLSAATGELEVSDAPLDETVTSEDWMLSFSRKLRG